MVYDVIVIGSGPAGLTSAIYAARSDLNVLVLEGEQPGGQLTTTTEVENFPGFPEGIMGPELMNNMRKQAQRFKAETKYELVSSVDFSNKIFKVTANETYEAKAVIIATGSRARYLGLESESHFKGRGVSACATCDGFFFKDKEIVVIGGGDSAMEEANFLTKFASKVTLVHRNENFKASQIMLDRTKENPKIEFLMNKQVLEVLGDKTMSGLKLKDNVSGEETELNAEGMFLAIGHIPNTEIFKDKLEMENGYIITKPDSAKTSVEGVFAAGDVQDTERFWQAITSAGSGCIAALEAEKYLSND